jgi:diaminohydroxyphosphoribosylaminopyrimidine deaminase/5-amino-6-(5-phosphoribosylamino)uracil reductase
VAAPHELEAMRRAIALSAQGLGSTSPNPPVGCVILTPDGAVIGEGWHRQDGGPHAEVNALADAGERAAGGTAVVTLEPCNHVGRTPACRQALLDAEVARVVVAIIDPTSRHGGGVARLRAGGVDVEVGVLADEARAVLGPWLTATARRRPWVTWTTGQGTAVDALRRTHDVVVTAGGSVEAGVPGGHGSALRAGLAGIDAVELAVPAFEDLFARGVRTVLVVSDTAPPAALVDATT